MQTATAHAPAHELTAPEPHTPQKNGLRDYVDNIRGTTKSFWHGMSVTLSYMFRKPITAQYPDRMPVGRLADTLPARYRGFLEVDRDICTVCKACERACPIDCISIGEIKDPKTRKLVGMDRFDIDIGKCMFCGLCVEPCPTGAIQHTREFESASASFTNLTFRFVPEGTVSPVYKVPKGSTAFMRAELGSITRAIVKNWDAPPPPFPAKDTKKPTHAATTKPSGAAGALGRELAVRALEAKAKSDIPKLQKTFEDAMAGTDCGDCGYADCFGYSDALAKGLDFDPGKCAPGGAESKGNLEVMLVALKTGKAPEAPVEAVEAAPTPVEAAPTADGADALQKELVAKTVAAKDNPDALKAVFEEAMAGTDCGDCGYADCDGYSTGIAKSGDNDPSKCAPGGSETTANLRAMLVSLGRKPTT